MKSMTYKIRDCFAPLAMTTLGTFYETITNGITKEMRMVKNRQIEGILKSSSPLLYHILILGVSAALVLSLPFAIRFIAQKLLIYWSLVGNDKIFFISVELISTLLFLFFVTCLRQGWKDRQLSNMARSAGLILVSPPKGFLAQRRARKLKERQGPFRDVMVIRSTGYRSLADPEGDLHPIVQNCQDVKIMLLDPHREGAVARAKSIPDPEVTPESYGEQIRKTIDFLKTLKASQKNVRLKLYPDPPFLKMTILGNYIWLQHYQPGLDVRGMPNYVFKHDPDTGGLYLPFYHYFMGRWNNPEIPEYDLETDELIYRNMAGNEVRREKAAECKLKVSMGRDFTDQAFPETVDEKEDSYSPGAWSHADRASPGKDPADLHQTHARRESHGKL